MKKSLKNLFGFLFIALTVFSCTKKEDKDYLLGGTAPVLTASFNAANFNFANADNTVLSLNWTNPNYQFSTGPGSQDVAYLLEIDTTGSNFTNPQRQSITISKDLGVSYTAAQLNSYFLNELLAPAIPHNIEIRVKASLANSTATLISNVIKLTATPYAIPPKVTAPATGNLYLVGNATPGGDATGWNNPVPVPSQQFTKITATLYEITIPLIGGKEYLLLPLNGDWGHKYAVPDKTVAGLSAGGDFGFDKSDNFPAPSASGTYKIQVNFQTGKFTVTKQ